MKTKIDSVVGKAIYGKRIATTEPPFAHSRRVMGLDRFTLRGRSRVNGQWLLFCTVHNQKKVIDMEWKAFLLKRMVIDRPVEEKSDQSRAFLVVIEVGIM